MICTKCNHNLPDDSEFCQYCGNKIEKVEVYQEEQIEEVAKDVVDSDEISDIDLPDLENATREEVLNAIIKFQAKQTIKNLKNNSQNQPNNEEDADFGLVPEKPIYTLAIMSVDGEIEYLNRLYTENGVKVKWERRGSTGAKGVSGLIDIYNTYLPSGEFYKTIYINMYGAKKSQTAPVGFVLNDAGNKPKKAKTVKSKYCSRCGYLIDNETKQCSGCGKKYFKGIRFNKIFFIILSFSLALLIAIAVNINQSNKTNEIKSNLRNQIIGLNDKISILNGEISVLNGEIGSLNGQIYTLKNQKNGLEEKYNALIDFVDNNLVFVEKNSTNLYHKFECYEFERSSYYAFNIEAAKRKGYKECTECH